MSSDRWIMPEWMESYLHIMGPREVIEERMNVSYCHGELAVQDIFNLTCATRVALLTALHDEGLLKEVA